jgi:hypothetical protein
MPVSAVFALGAALVASLCLLAHTIYRQPTTASAAATEKRRRLPIVSSNDISARDFQAPGSLGEVDDAYRAWVQSLNDAESNAGSVSHSSR